MARKPYAVEAGIPIPGEASKYPLAVMRIGDSFLIPYRADIPKNRHQARVASVIAAYGRRHPQFRFTTRQMANGIRVWRVPTPRALLDETPPPMPTNYKARIHLLDEVKPRRRA